jgi:SSS family solute:Na+ symporter
MSQRARIVLTRVFLVMIAIFLVIWGLWYDLGQDLWDYMAVSGAIYFTGAFAILLLGLYWKRASTAGAFSALFIGTLAVIGLKPVQTKLDLVDYFKEKGIESHHIGLTVSFIAIIGMIVMSVVVPDQKERTENFN